MSSKIRTPTLALATLSLCLSLAAVGTAGRSLSVYYSEQRTNPWLLPVWPNHFDLRELQMLVGSAAVIAACNAVLAISLFVQKLPANGIVVVSALLSTLISIISIVFTTVLHYNAPQTDTLRTWTCRWTYVKPSLHSLGVPEQFQGLCHKTRFAYYSTIPLLVIQFLLLGLGVWTLFDRSPKRSGHDQLEKGADSLGHPLKNMSNVRETSLETKSERSYQESTKGFDGRK